MKKAPLDRVSKSIREAEFNGFASRTRENCRAILQDPTAPDYLARVDKLFDQLKVLDNRGVFSRESTEIDIDQVMTEKSARQLQQAFAEITLANGVALITDPYSRIASMRVKRLEQQIPILNNMGVFSSDNKVTDANPIMSEQQLSELETILNVVKQTYGVAIIIPSKTTSERVETPQIQAGFGALDQYLEDDNESMTQISLDALSMELLSTEHQTSFLVALDEGHLTTVTKEIERLEKLIDKNRKTLDEAGVTKNYLNQETTLSDEAKTEINQSLDGATMEARASIEKAQSKLPSLITQRDELTIDIKPKQQIASKETELLQQLKEYHQKPDLEVELKSAQSELEKIAKQFASNSTTEVDIETIITAANRAADSLGKDLQHESKKLAQWKNRQERRGKFSKKTRAYQKSTEKVSHYQETTQNLLDKLKETQQLIDLNNKCRALESRIEKIPELEILTAAVKDHKESLSDTLPQGLTAFEKKSEEMLTSTHDKDQSVGQNEADQKASAEPVEIAHAIIDEKHLLDQVSAMEKIPDLQKKLTELKSKIKQSEISIREYTSLQNQINQATVNQNVSLDEDISRLVTALQTTHKKLEQWQQKLPNTETKKSQAKGEIKVLIEKIAKIDRQPTQHTERRPNKEADDLDAQRTKLADDLATARSKLKNLEQDPQVQSKAERKVSAYQAEANQTQQKIDQLTQKLHDNKESLEPGKGDFADLIAPHQECLERAQQQAKIISEKLDNMPNSKIIGQTIDLHQKQLAQESPEKLLHFQKALDSIRGIIEEKEEPKASIRKRRVRRGNESAETKNTTKLESTEKQNSTHHQNQTINSIERKDEGILNKKTFTTDSKSEVSPQQKIDELHAKKEKITGKIEIIERNDSKSINEKIIAAKQKEQLKIKLKTVETAIENITKPKNNAKQKPPAWASTERTAKQEKDLQHQKSTQTRVTHTVGDSQKNRGLRF